MTLMFPHGDQLFKLQVNVAHKVIDGHIGYRNYDQILLRKDVFDEFIYNLKNDDFAAIRSILNQLIDFNSCDLPWEHTETKELSYGIQQTKSSQEDNGGVRYPVPAVITRFIFGRIQL